MNMLSASEFSCSGIKNINETVPDAVQVGGKIYKPICGADSIGADSADQDRDRDRDKAKAEDTNTDGAPFSHYPVMLGECISALNIKKGGIYVDCTAGGGGHSEAVLKRLKELGGGLLIAIDQDEDAIRAVTKRLSSYENEGLTEIHKCNFSELSSVLDGRLADGVLIDLGVSSHQIDTPERGFSYMHDAPLDMRMDQSAPVSAYELINQLPENELASVIFRFGEEKFSRQIASSVCRKRESAPIKTTLELASIISAAIPPKFREKGSHPAKRTFQALRIAVNHELDIIEPTLRSAVSNLAPGGRIAVLTFHSLEDRIVKQTFVSLASGCECPKSLPICVCGKKPVVSIVTRKPLLPSDAELDENSRSHSAKLRVAEKLR